MGYSVRAAFSSTSTLKKTTSEEKLFTLRSSFEMRCSISSRTFLSGSLPLNSMLCFSISSTPSRLRRLFLEGFFRSFGGELQFTSIGIVIDDDRLSIPDFALQDEPAERSFDFLLDRALQRTRAIVGIVSDAHEMSLCRVRKFDPNVAFIEPPAQMLELDVDNLLQMFFRKGMEHDDLIHAIEKFRTEVIAHLRQYRFLHPFIALPFESPAILQNAMAADVRCHDDDRVLEIDCSSLTIGQPAVIQDLEQHVEDVAVRFLHLVKKDHGKGPPPDGFGELAAFFVSDIARGCADEPGDGVLLLVLGHVDPDHGVFVIKQGLR